jgi:hypothetical protein
MIYQMSEHNKKPICSHWFYTATLFAKVAVAKIPIKASDEHVLSLELPSHKNFFARLKLSLLYSVFVVSSESPR